MRNSKRDDLRNEVDSIINGLESEVNFEDMPEEQLRREITRSQNELELKAEMAGAEYLGITIDGKFDTSIITKAINEQMAGSGLTFRDVLNKRTTKEDIKKFSVKKINEQLPTGLKFRSLNRQDLNRGVKNYVKSALKKAAFDRASELVLDDDPEVLAMIQAYTDGRGISNGNKDATGAARQADFRANHVYGWVEK